MLRFGRGKYSVDLKEGRKPPVLECQVRLMVNYLRRLKSYPWSPEDFLFCSLSGQGVPRRGTQISYKNAKSVLAASLMMIGFDEDLVKKCGLHSFRLKQQVRLIIRGN